MRFKQLLFPPPPSSAASAGLLLLRVVAGLSMATHGWKKIQNPMHWMDGATNPPPNFLQALAAVAEFFGGLGLALGALSVVAAFGIACTMVVALQLHLAKGDPFGKVELPALFLAIVVLVMLAGPGRFSVDAWLRRRLGLPG